MKLIVDSSVHSPQFSVHSPVLSPQLSVHRYSVLKQQKNVQLILQLHLKVIVFDCAWSVDYCYLITIVKQQNLVQSINFVLLFKIYY